MWKMVSIYITCSAQGHQMPASSIYLSHFVAWRAAYCSEINGSINSIQADNFTIQSSSLLIHEWQWMFYSASVCVAISLAICSTGNISCQSHEITTHITTKIQWHVVCTFTGSVLKYYPYYSSSTVTCRIYTRNLSFFREIRSLNIAAFIP